MPADVPVITRDRWGGLSRPDCSWRRPKALDVPVEDSVVVGDSVWDLWPPAAPAPSASACYRRVWHGRIRAGWPVPRESGPGGPPGPPRRGWRPLTDCQSGARMIVIWSSTTAGRGGGVAGCREGAPAPGRVAAPPAPVGVAGARRGGERGGPAASAALDGPVAGEPPAAASALHGPERGPGRRPGLPRVLPSGAAHVLQCVRQARGSGCRPRRPPRRRPRVGPTHRLPGGAVRGIQHSVVSRRLARSTRRRPRARPSSPPRRVRRGR